MLVSFSFLSYNQKATAEQETGKRDIGSADRNPTKMTDSEAWS